VGGVVAGPFWGGELRRAWGGGGRFLASGGLGGWGFFRGGTAGAGGRQLTNPVPQTPKPTKKHLNQTTTPQTLVGVGVGAVGGVWGGVGRGWGGVWGPGAGLSHHRFPFTQTPPVGHSGGVHPRFRGGTLFLRLSLLSGGKLTFHGSVSDILIKMECYHFP